MNKKKNCAKEIRQVKVPKLALPPTGTSPNWHFPQLALPPTGSRPRLKPPTAGTPMHIESFLVTLFDENPYQIDELNRDGNEFENISNFLYKIFLIQNQLDATCAKLP